MPRLVLAAALFLALAACQSRTAPERPAETHAGTSAARDAVTRDTVETPAEQLAAMTHDGAARIPGRYRVLHPNDSLWQQALRIHYDAITVDGHLDTPTLMFDGGYDVTRRHHATAAHADLPRMAEGGLDAAFFSIYVPPYYGETPRAADRVRRMIAEVKRQVRSADTTAAMAYSADDVRRIVRSGKTAVLLGLEGGHALMASPDTLRAFYEAGIRYVTLTHVNTNSWADASQSAPRHGGLNERGREMVRAMNDLGVLVDLSHASDSTFYGALAVSRAPDILSHSSMRALAPNVRNVSDAMLRALAENGGVVMINFFDAMVNPHLDAEVMAEARRRLAARGLSPRRLWSVVYEIKRERGLPGATLADVLDHIDHAVEVAGIDHVGLGSDFDGVFDLPAGLRDVTRLPWITYGLLKRGYSRLAITQLLGGNTLRVMEAAERAAEQAVSD